MNFDEIKGALKNSLPSNPAILNGLFTFLDKLSLAVNAKKSAMFFGNFQLPTTDDVSLVEHSYDKIVPFLVESASGVRDIYCLEFEEEAFPKVAVFSDHAFIQRWDSVSDFLSWLDSMAND